MLLNHMIPVERAGMDFPTAEPREEIVEQVVTLTEVRTIMSSCLLINLIVTGTGQAASY